MLSVQIRDQRVPDYIYIHEYNRSRLYIECKDFCNGIEYFYIPYQTLIMILFENFKFIAEYLFTVFNFIIYFFCFN